MASKFPAKLGSCVDLAYTLRAERLEIERQADEVKAKETLLKDHIINTFSKADIDGAKGKVASASITRSVKGNVTDWSQVYAFVAKKGAWDLMERRLNNKAYRDRLEAGEEIPGTESFDVVTLSLTKIGGK
jgi:hypothetical protein